MTHLSSIKAIKNSLIEDVSKYWVRAWLLHIIQKPSSFLITDDDYQLTDSELEQFNAGVTKIGVFSMIIVFGLPTAAPAVPPSQH